MARKKDTLRFRIKFNSTMDKNYFEAFNALVNKTKRTKTSLVDEMVELILEKYEVPIPEKAKDEQKEQEKGP